MQGAASPVEALDLTPAFGYDDTNVAFDNYRIMFELANPQTSLNLDIDWAPAYELILSLGAYVDKKSHKDTELGPAWVRRTRQKLPAAFHEQLAQALEELHKHEKRDKPFKPHLHGELHFHLIRDCPGERDAASYIEWLESLSVGELYERVAPQWPETMALPRDLGALRDRQVPVFRLWNEHYFSRVEPAILAALRDDARRLRARAQGTAQPTELIEQATNGLVFGPSPMSEVVLVPQHHMVPFNSMAKGHRRLIVLYPVDVNGTASGAPPPTLRRLARALADESRLRILRELSTDEPRTLTDVARAVKLSQSTMHHHLVLLRTAGIVRVHIGEGHTNQYTLRPNAVESVATHLRQYLTPVRPARTSATARRQER